MKLYYRGLVYELTADQITNRKPRKPFQSVCKLGAAYNLNYRGISFSINPNNSPAKLSVKPVVYKLMYRGITYLVSRNEQGIVERIRSFCNPEQFDIVKTAIPSS